MTITQTPIPSAWVEPLLEWRRSLVAAGRSLQTVRLRTGWLRRFARAVDVDPWTVDDEDIIRWSASHEWAQDTRRSAHQSVAGFYAWARTAGHVDRVPLIPPVRQSPPSPHPADDRSVEIALASRDPRVVLMVRLGCEAGLRRGEVARVHSRDLVSDLTGRTLIVHGKGGRSRLVPLSDSLAEALEAEGAGWTFPGQDHGHLSPAWVGTLVGRALPQGVTMHALRHRFASRAYSATHDLVGVQTVLGHSSPSTTLRYVAVPDASLRAVVNAAA